MTTAETDLSAAKTPAEQLARRIAQALADSKTVTATRQEDISKKLANGSAKASDWRLWAEFSLDEGTRAAAHEQERKEVKFEDED